MLAHTRCLALLLSVSFLTGCAVGPDYRSPEIALSSRFLGQEDVVHRQVQSKADLTTWWAGFDDPLLTRFISLALEQNLDIAQAAARVAQSRASLRQADAALLPSANVSANAARAYQSVETPLGQVLDATPDFDRSGSYYEANLGASWEIDVFGGLRRGREAARAEYQASEAGAVATRLAVAAQTADVYVTIRGLAGAHRDRPTTSGDAPSASLHGQAPVREGDRRRAADAPSRGFARSGRGADPRPGSRARFGDERAGRAARGAAGNLPRRAEPGGVRSRSLRVWPRPARRPR